MYTKKLVKVATFFIWVYPSVRKVALLSHFLVIFKMRDTLPHSNKFQDIFLFPLKEKPAQTEGQLEIYL